MFKFVLDIDKKKIISFPGKTISGYRFLISSNYLEDATGKAKKRIQDIYNLNNSVVDNMLSFCLKEVRNEEPNSSFLLYQENFTQEELELLTSYSILIKQNRGYVLSYENSIDTIFDLFNDIKRIKNA
jgi:hypothetical protein